VKDVLLVNALLTILFLSATYGGRVHDKRIADATPYPLPAGSRLLQDLGFLAFTLPQVEILMPTKKPRGQEFTLEEQLDVCFVNPSPVFLLDKAGDCSHS